MAHTNCHCNSFITGRPCTCGPCGPCGPIAPSTAACESLSSQIENFTKQFFGELVKTEINGQVQWVLPCYLDIGLPANPRAVGEGLACYFLRLFNDGIIGLTGPAGATGPHGVNGENPYTVTLLSFAQPSLAAPTVQVKTLFNSAIVAGLNVFIQGSGWYSVDLVDTAGNLYLTLTRPLSGIAGTITAGKLVVPSGYPGASVAGTPGAQGPQGPQGPAGVAVTNTHGYYFSSAGTNYVLPIIPTAVNFTTSSPAVLLPVAGSYLLTAKVSVFVDSGIALSDIISLKLFNTSIAGDVTASEQRISGLVSAQISSVTLNAIYSTASSNQTIALFGSCTTTLQATVEALRTTLSYVRIG